MKFHTSFRKIFLLALIGVSCLAWPATAATVAVPPGERGFELWRFLGPFHVLVLHYPIGFVTLAFIFEGLLVFRPNLPLRGAISITLALAAVSAITAVGLGLMLEATGGYESRVLTLHKWLGLGVAVLISLACGVELFRKKFTTNPRWLWSYRGLLAATMGTLVAAGHQGGNLTHGSDFLTKAAPAFIQKLAAENQPVEKTKSDLPADAGSQQFAAHIRPIFEAKCYGCHGPEKHKGDYRLDDKSVAFAGGESHLPAIKPGEPFASHLVKLITLPDSDDDAMPPAGKTRLTGDEIVAIIRWVQAGAPFPDNSVSPAGATASANSSMAVKNN